MFNSHAIERRLDHHDRRLIRVGHLGDGGDIALVGVEEDIRDV
jgi:hypothetical protein